MLTATVSLPTGALHLGSTFEQASGAEVEAEIVGTDEFDDEKHYQVEWADMVKERVDSYLDREAALLEASADSDGMARHQREATAREVADGLDTSHQSVAELLRRGTGNLVEPSLPSGSEDPDNTMTAQ